MMPFQEGLLLTFSEGLDQRVEEHGIVPEIIRKYYVEVCEAPWRDALPGFEDDFYKFRDMAEWVGIIETLELREYDACFDQDRKSVVLGQSVSVRVDLRGRRN